MATKAPFLDKASDAFDFDKDFEQFDHELRDFTDNVMPEEANKIKRIIGLQLLTDVVLMTRVDTGRARGGWTVTLDEPTSKQLKRTDKTGNHVIGVGANKVGEAEFGQDIWINNNVTYIKYLNNGTETRVGDFMVERALTKANSQFS